MNDILTRIPDEGKKLYDDMHTGRVLGAANHIRMIGDILRLVAAVDADDETTGIASSEEMRRKDVLDLCRFFQNTRGKSSYAIVTALNLMTRYVRALPQGDVAPGAHSADATDIARALHRGIDEYLLQADENASSIVEYAGRLAQSMDTFIVYDYSSTVEAFVASLARPRRIYVPESRIIDGGKPFLSTFAHVGHDVHYIPDAAMLTVLGECHGAFIGAETFYPDGTAFNTAGSDILAELCAARSIPYYVLTPLIKLDMRAAFGIYKQPVKGNMSDILGKSLDPELRSKLHMSCIELVAIPPAHITAFVTEAGIVPPAAMYGLSVEYDRRVNALTERSTDR